MWVGTSSFVEFGRNIVKLDIDYSKWDCYKRLSELSGYRIMHSEFCLISERPTVLKTRKQGERYIPHCETGSFCQWADGSALYSLNGVRVPKWLVDTPAERIDPKLALTEKNVDVQREIIRKIGAEKILKASNAKLLDEFTYEKTGCKYKLYHMKLNGSIDRKYLYFEAASLPGVYYCQPVPLETTKALHGLGWMRHLTEQEKLAKINIADEAEMIAALPDVVS